MTRPTVGFEAVVRRWGGSCAVVVPRVVLDVMDLGPGDVIRLVVEWPDEEDIGTGGDE